MVFVFISRYKFVAFFLLFSSLFSAGNTITVLSPNGGEILSTSTTTLIQWRGSANKSNFVKIFFSTNNGAEWKEIGFSQDKGSYVWETPNRGFSNCLIKIQDFKKPEKFDISDKVFSIKGPTIKLNSPLNGHEIESREKYNITWETSDLVSSSVRIYYSLDNGSNWELIVNKVKDVGSYYWKVPDVYGVINECLIKIEEFGNPSLYDITAGNFSIIGVQPTIQVLSPIPGEVISANIDYTIKWDSKHLKSKFVKLYYSINGGASWRKISSLTPDEGKLNWLTPNVTSQICLIKIEDAGDHTTSVMIDDLFTITKNPNITLINPESGIKIDPMLPFKVEWNSMNLSSDRVNIYYSINNKINWKSIYYQALDTMSILWEVPEFTVDQNQCFIKIEDVGNSDVFSENETAFIISGIPMIEIINPIGKELLPANTNYKIKWETSNLNDNFVAIFLSTNGGLNWDIVSDSVPDYGVYDWDVPQLNSKEAIIKIQSSSNEFIKDQNKKYFELNANPLTIFSSPLYEDRWIPYATQLIKWKSYNMPSDFVNIYLSKDKGLTYEPLIMNMKNGGAYPLTTPVISSTISNAMIKIEDSKDKTIFQLSDIFSIIAAPRLEINYPNGDEVFVTTSKVPIKWESFNQSGKYVNLYYSLNNGNKWEKIKSDVKNNGEFIWATPLITKTINNFKIKIRDSYNSKTSVISNSFTLKIPDPKITILNPMVDESISSGKLFNIEWSSISLSDQGVNLYYSIDDGINWEEIGEYISNNGIYKWNVPKLEEVSENCKIMIQDAGQHHVVEISENFTIDGYPELFLDIPFIGNRITNSSSQEINWIYKNLNGRLINIYYSIDKGKNWVEIEKDFPINEKFIWVVPNIEKSSNKCRIKIEIAGNESINDEIKKNFSIKVLNSSISLKGAIGGQRLSGGDTLKVSWQGKDISDKGIELSYSIDNKKKWKKIKSNMKVKGSYYWIIPKLNKIYDNCYIKLEDMGNDQIFDVSEKKFTIKPPSKIRISTPNGGERVKTKSGIYIAWDGNRMQGDKVDIFYSLNNGKSWELIQKDAKNSGSTIWKVPNKKSKKCLVKVQNSSDSEDYDVSNRTFIIR